MTSRFSSLATGQEGTVADRRVCESKRRFVPEAGSRDACQKLSPKRTCSGSFAARIVVRLCGGGFAMHPGCSVSCTGVDRFGWSAHWDGIYRYTTDEETVRATEA